MQLRRRNDHMRQMEADTEGWENDTDKIGLISTFLVVAVIANSSHGLSL